MATPPPDDLNFIYFGPDSNCTLDLCPIEASVYSYRPSLQANIVFVALYSIAGLLHAYLGFRWRQWFFTGCIIAGCIIEIVGYVGRVLMYGNPFDFTAFLMQIGEFSLVSLQSYALTVDSLHYLWSGVLHGRNLYHPLQDVSIL